MEKGEFGSAWAKSINDVFAENTEVVNVPDKGALGRDGPVGLRVAVSAAIIGDTSSML